MSDGLPETVAVSDGSPETVAPGDRESTGVRALHPRERPAVCVGAGQRLHVRGWLPRAGLALLPLLPLAAICGLAMVTSADAARIASSGDGDETPHIGYIADTLLVEAVRIPTNLRSEAFSISHLQVGELSWTDAGLSFEGILATVPGVYIANRHNLSQGDRVSIRGVGSQASFGVRGVRVLLDGIPLTMPDGQTQLGMVDLSLIDRVEILRGPSAVLYGNAAGGVVRLRSVRSTHRRGRTGLVVGSHGLRQLRLSGSHVDGPLSLQFGASQTDLDGYRQHSNARQRTLSMIGRRNLGESATLTAVLHLLDAPYLLNPSSLDRSTADDDPESARFFVRQQGAGKRVRHDQLGLGVEWQRTGVERLQFEIHGVRRSLLNPIPGEIIDLDRVAGGAQLSYGRESQWAMGRLSLLAGADWESQRDKRKEFDNDGLTDEDIDRFDDARTFDRIRYGELLLRQTERIGGIGAFVRARFWPRPAWSITAGARLDRHSFDVEDRLVVDGDDSGERALNQLSPVFGVLYRPTGLIDLFANYSTAFQTPTAVELGNRADGRGGFNPDLEPEHLRSMELGLRALWPERRLEGDLALYRLDFEDLLIPFQQKGGDAVFYRNAGKARNLGAEARVVLNPRGDLQLDVASTWSNFEFTDYLLPTDEGAVQLRHHDVPGVPALAVQARLSYRSLNAGIFGHLLARRRSQTFTSDLNGPKPGDDGPPRAFVNDGYTTLDGLAGLRRLLGGWEIEGSIGVENLLDELYSGSIVPNAFGNRFFEPAPGRTWRLGLSLSRARP